MIRKIFLRLGQLVFGLVCIAGLVGGLSSTGDEKGVGWTTVVISLVLFWGWSRIFRGKPKSPQEISEDSTGKEKTRQNQTTKEERIELISDKEESEENSVSNKIDLEYVGDEPQIQFAGETETESSSDIITLPELDTEIDELIDVDKQSTSGIDVALEDYEGLLVTLLAALAYWGDGGISKNEKAYLLRIITDSLLKSDTVEPEVESRELLLLVLETLESARNDYEQKVDKEKAINEIVKFYAGEIRKKAKNRSSVSSKRKALLKEAITACETVIEIDGVTAFEKELVKLIKKHAVGKMAWIRN